jgi:two-component system phosphate regulon sensor histidine kinase PhoR
MRADFIANASHEIRTPLSSLIGFIETLRGPARDNPEAQEHFFEIMEQNARRMARLVDDLLSLSRIEIKEHEVPSDQVALGPLLEAAREDVSWDAKPRNITIAIDFPDGPLTARGEANELSQVFHNLFDNAVKYGREGGTVRVSVRTLTPPPAELRWPADAKCALAISVADEGEGIACEHLPRLTERFYRVDTTRSRELGGTGLGLAIVKHVVARHRGTLSVDSELGRGSTFTVYLRTAPPPGEEGTS